MFRLFPVIAASCFQLTALPVEMWSTILRLLDPISLLNSVRSDPRWENICFGDGVLKKRLQVAVNLEFKLARETIINPGKFVSVFRTESAKMFATNVDKKISRKPNPVSSDALRIIKKSSMKSRRQVATSKSTKKYVSYRL